MFAFPVWGTFSTASAPAAAQSFNSQPMFSSPVFYETQSTPQKISAPVQVRKTFPESWIFDNIDETR